MVRDLLLRILINSLRCKKPWHGPQMLRMPPARPILPRLLSYNDRI